MNFITAILMTYISPEDSLCVMTSLMNKYGLLPCYKQGMPGLANNFYVFLSLMKKYMPKLNNHLLELKFTPQMYASQWFLTIFAVYFPIEVVVRIWDVFLVEGRKTIFRIGLAIMKLNQKLILSAPFEQIFIVLKDFST